MVSIGQVSEFIRPKKLLPGFHLLVMLVMLTTPFGEFQQHFLNGFTPAKLIIPFLLCYLLCVRLDGLKLHPLIGNYCLFVFCTLPSLLIGVEFISVLVSLIGYICLFQVLYEHRFSLPKIKELIGAYIYGTFLVCILVLQIFITGFDIGASFGKPFIEYWIGMPLVSGTSNNTNGFASLLLPAVPLTYSFLLTSKSKISKIVHSVILATIFLTLAITFSRSAIGASILACIVLHHSVKHKSIFSLSLCIKLLAVLMTLVLSGSIYYLLIDLVTSDATGVSGNYSTLSSNKEMSEGYRTLVLMPMLNIFLDNIFLGVGFGNVKPLIEAQTGLYINSHNTPFGIAMDYGIFALIFLVSTVAYSIQDYNLALKRAADLDSRLLISGLFVSLGAMIFHGLFHEMYISFMLWLFIAMGPIVKRAIPLV
jgi:hypothetical protein